VRRVLLTALVALGLTVLAPTISVADPSVVHPEWGSTTAQSAKLRTGCHGYPYGYALTPPDGDWALETYLVGPHGKQYGSGYFQTGGDPLAGTGAWRLCLRSTRGGIYTIRARLTVLNGGDSYDGWLPDSTFRLRKPRR
jgi:hypothetical protein